MILTEEPAQPAKNCFLKLSSHLPPSKVRGALSNVHVESGIPDVVQLPNLFASQMLNPHRPCHEVSMIVLDSIQGPNLSASNFEAC